MRPIQNKTSGFSLIELLIAVALGIVVVGATLGIFAANRRTYVAAENMGRVQENARVAYELMTRDVREAGGNPCVNGRGTLSIPVVNILNGAGTQWWRNWNNPVFGYENGALAGTVAGTDAIEIKSGDESYFTVVSHPTGGTTININSTTSTLAANDVLMICDFVQASIFQTNSVSGSAVGYSTTGSIGNCTTGLGVATPINPACTPTSSQYYYQSNSLVTKLNASQWYIAVNANGGRSLFRNVLRGGAVQAEEIAEGVRDMQVTYLLPGTATTYVTATAITAAGRWHEVSGVRILLTMEGTDRIGTNGQTLQRTMQHTVALRNRNS